MTIEVFDTFIGAAGTLIPTYNPAWSLTDIINMSNNTGKLTGDGAARGSNNSICGYAHSTVISAANCSVTCNVVRRTATGTALFRSALRISPGVSPTHYYVITWSDPSGGSSGSIILSKFVSGVTTILGDTGENLFPTLNVPRKVELRAMGSSIKVLVDDVEKISAIDSSVPSAGRIGFQLRQPVDTNNTAVHLLDITGESLGSGFTITPSGGIVFSGIGSIVTFRDPSRVIPVTGGIVFSGTGDQLNFSAPPHIITPSGGITFGGTGDILFEKSPPHVIPVAGGIVFSGSAPMLFNYEIPEGGPRMPLTGVGL